MPEVNQIELHCWLQQRELVRTYETIQPLILYIYIYIYIIFIMHIYRIYLRNYPTVDSIRISFIIDLINQCS
eukprot:COSAG06_NODE_3074_length_5891_cov_6.288847_3_plen_72_part_00